MSDEISEEDLVNMAKVGKKLAGRTLDSVIHDGYPEREQ